MPTRTATQEQRSRDGRY